MHVLVSAPRSRTTHTATATFTACSRKVPENWVLSAPTEAMPTCKSCIRALSAASSTPNILETLPGVTEAELFDLERGTRDPETDPLYLGWHEPLDNLDLTTTYHERRGTPAVHAPTVTPDGPGVMVDHHGPNSVIVRLSDGTGTFNVYSPEDVRRPSPLLDMPQRRPYYPVRQIRAIKYAAR